MVLCPSAASECDKMVFNLLAAFKWAAVGARCDRGFLTSCTDERWVEIGSLQTPKTQLALLTCVASVTDASCLYSEFPQPYSCPSLETARLQSPYVLICCTSTPVKSPPTSTGLELMLWCPRPEIRHKQSNVPTEFWRLNHLELNSLYLLHNSTLKNNNPHPSQVYTTLRWTAFGHIT